MVHLHHPRVQSAPHTRLTLVLVALLAQSAGAQGPNVDVPQPPGMRQIQGRLGAPIGASGITTFANTPGSQDSPLGGRPGPSVSRAPLGGYSPSTRPPAANPTAIRVSQTPTASVPNYGDLALPDALDAPPAPNSLTLDAAIERLLHHNLPLIALRYEIPLAAADELTASLRPNPIFYADAQLVPYGNYTRAAPGGPTQYDVNVTLPFDVSGKRKARMLAATKARCVTEAQLQDAVRLQIDNLYTAYIDTLAAQETLRFSRAYLEGIQRLLALNEDLLKRGQITEASVDLLRVQVEQAQFQVREAGQAVMRTRTTLAQLLNIPRSEVAALEVAGALRDIQDPPLTEVQLIQNALQQRPDLAAFRLGVQRAAADIQLAKAERYSDVYVLAQPYTFQDNRAYGLKSPYSWAVGVTVPLPVFNRNQGNVARAHVNLTQTQVELAALERQIADEVDQANREFLLSRDGVLEIEREILPASTRVRDAAFRRFQGGQASAIEYLEAQRQYNDVVRDYRDSLVRHRRAMLDLNTAVGARVLP
jgi:cobalt-zinc-cadmium efflux system outer membrane protein